MFLASFCGLNFHFHYWKAGRGGGGGFFTRNAVILRVCVISILMESAIKAFTSRGWLMKREWNKCDSAFSCGLWMTRLLHWFGLNWLIQWSRIMLCIFLLKWAWIPRKCHRTCKQRVMQLLCTAEDYFFPLEAWESPKHLTSSYFCKSRLLLVCI